MSEDFRDQLPEVSLLDGRTTADVETEMIADYQARYRELTGAEIVLDRASTDALKLAAAAQQIHHVEQYIESMYHRQLLKYAAGNDLDNLGALFHLTRRPAVRAETVLEFSMTSARTAATGIPGGIRAATQTGIYFVTQEYAEIPAGEQSAAVRASCILPGSLGNGYLPGAVNQIVDPLPYIAAVTNTTVSTGGAEIESDQAFAYRVYLAPPAYSTAGPKDAYEYLAKTARADIVDARASSPTPGVAKISVLMEDGVTADADIIADIAGKLSGAEVRPMTDDVQVAAATEIGYQVTLTYYIARSQAGQAAAIQRAADAAVTDYVAWQRKIGRDINPTELIFRLRQAGVKRCEVTAPTHVAIDEDAVPQLTARTVTYGGLEND